MDLMNAKALARRTMNDHGLYDWTFKFDGAKRRAGMCDHSERIIFMSRYFVGIHDEAEISNTILHEIAHALVGPGHGHGMAWKKKAAEIGCDGERCVTVADRAPFNFIPHCAGGHDLSALGAYRVGKRMKRWACKRCGDGQPLTWVDVR